KGGEEEPRRGSIEHLVRNAASGPQSRSAPEWRPARRPTRERTGNATTEHTDRAAPSPPSPDLSGELRPERLRPWLGRVGREEAAGAKGRTRAGTGGHACAQAQAAPRRHRLVLRRVLRRSRAFRG